MYSFVMIGDDHDLVREALRYLIDSYRDLRVIRGSRERGGCGEACGDIAARHYLARFSYAYHGG